MPRMTRIQGRRALVVALAGLLVLTLLAGVALAVTYHGNVQSKIFHAPGCRYYSCSACVAVFPSREKALAAGFRPCKVCRP